MTTKKGEKIVITSQEYADFMARSKFVGFYVPLTFSTEEVCQSLSVSVYSTMDKIEKSISFQAFSSGGTSDDLPQLVFTKRVYIYYEGLLTLQEKSSIERIFQKQGMDVEFRGIDYLQDQAKARKLKQMQDNL